MNYDGLDVENFCTQLDRNVVQRLRMSTLESGWNATNRLLACYPAGGKNEKTWEQDWGSIVVIVRSRL